MLVVILVHYREYKIVIVKLSFVVNVFISIIVDVVNVGSTNDTVDVNIVVNDVVAIYMILMLLL